MEFSSGVFLLTNCAHRGWQRFGFSQNPVACPSAVFGQTPARAGAVRRGRPKECQNGEVSRTRKKDTQDKQERRPVLKRSMGILGWPGHPSNIGAGESPLRPSQRCETRGGRFKKCRMGRGRRQRASRPLPCGVCQSPCCETWPRRRKTGGSSRRQRCRDLNPHGLGRWLPGRESTRYRSSRASSLLREETEISVALG